MNSVRNVTHSVLLMLAVPQAATFDDKARVCQRSFRLMRQRIDFPHEGIIFDCDVLTIATGLPERNPTASTSSMQWQISSVRAHASRSVAA